MIVDKAKVDIKQPTQARKNVAAVNIKQFNELLGKLKSIEDEIPSWVKNGDKPIESPDCYLHTYVYRAVLRYIFCAKKLYASLQSSVVQIDSNEIIEPEERILELLNIDAVLDVWVKSGVSTDGEEEFEAQLKRDIALEAGSCIGDHVQRKFKEKMRKLFKKQYVRKFPKANK